MLQDTPVLGNKSDKARRDANVIGNDLKYQQAYDLAATREHSGTNGLIAGGDSSSQVYAVRRRRGPQSHKSFNQKKNINGKKQFHPQKTKAVHKPCQKCGEHTKDSCPAKYATCNFCHKKLRKVNDMTRGDSSHDMNAYTLGRIGSITTTMKSVNSVSTEITDKKEIHIDQIYARVKLNSSHNIKLKVDTGSDTCTLTSTDLQKSTRGQHKA